MPFRMTCESSRSRCDALNLGDETAYHNPDALARYRGITLRGALDPWITRRVMVLAELCGSV